MTPEEIRKVDVEVAKLIAETFKLNAETRELDRRWRWYPLYLTLAVIGTVVGLAKLWH